MNNQPLTMLNMNRTQKDVDFLDTITLKDALLTAYDALTTQQKNNIITDGKYEGARVTLYELIVSALQNDENERNNQK
jgi:hypothetical protein